MQTATTNEEEIVICLFTGCQASNTLGFITVNFLLLSSSIQSGPIYGVYASQLIRYTLRYSNYVTMLSNPQKLYAKCLLILSVEMSCGFVNLS